MKYKHSLRFRITLSFFLFGTLLMIGVATGVHFAIEDIETRLVDESLRMEFNDFQKRYLADPEQPLPNSATVSAYLVDIGDDAGLPVYVRGLNIGTHEVEIGDKVYQVILGNLDHQKRLVLTRDGTLFEQREEGIFTAFIVSVVAASLFALWLGYALSRKVIAPVTNLANTVATLSPEKQDTVMSSSYADDEVGELAHAFERYLERLGDFIAREQEFTANASHELRTPLTVIRGAVELLMTDPELSPRARKVLQRIERASDAMSQMVETLLVLARESGAPGAQTCRLSEVVHEAVDEARELLADKPLKVVTQIEHDIELAVPHSIVAILLGNLLRNAVAYTAEGEITVSVEKQRVRVCDTGRGIRHEDLPHIFERHFRGQRDNGEGSGLGLAIVKRICDRYGWSIAVDSTSGKGTCVVVNFEQEATTTT